MKRTLIRAAIAVLWMLVPGGALANEPTPAGLVWTLSSRLIFICDERDHAMALGEALVDGGVADLFVQMAEYSSGRKGHPACSGWEFPNFRAQAVDIAWKGRAATTSNLYSAG